MGDVPASWETRRVKHVFEIKKRIAGEEGYDILSITQKGIRVKDIESNDGQLSMDYGKYQFVEVGDFAMNHMDLLTGYVDISPFFGVTSPDYRVFSVQDSNLCNAKYFLYLFQNGYRQRIFYAFGQGASQLGRWRFPTEQFNDFILPLPPYVEQSAIATFLDRETAKIDELIAEQEKLITLLAEKRQATISRAVTKGLNPAVPMKDSGVVWLGEVPAHWEVIGLTKYIQSVIDYRGRTPTKIDDGVFLVTAKNIRNGVIDYEASQEYISAGEYDDVMRRGNPEIGDVLFTTEAPLGQVAQVDRTDIALAQRIIKFRGDTEILDNSYLKYWVMGRHCQFNLETLATGSTALGIKGSKLGQVRLCLPPMDEQTAITFFLDAEIKRLDALTTEATRGIALLKERRSALISAAVTGKIDLRFAAGEIADEPMDATL